MRSFNVNRLAIVAGVAFSSSLFYASSSMAQVTTGDIIIGGEVASTLNIDIATVTGFDALDLGGDGTDNPETIVKIADLVVRTNNDDGLTLTITSGNMTATGSDTPLAYKVVTTGGAVQAVSADFDTVSGTPREETYEQGGGAGQLGANGSLARNLFISFDPPQNLDAGDYTGEITLTVANVN